MCAALTELKNAWLKAHFLVSENLQLFFRLPLDREIINLLDILSSL